MNHRSSGTNVLLAVCVKGGMPTLKATGRGRLGPVNNQVNSAPARPGMNRTPSTESQTSSTSWKPKMTNGSTATNNSSSSAGANRGPPPQPPPANRKPSLTPVI